MAAGIGITVTYDALTAAATKFANEASTLETSMQTVQTELQNLEGMWTGTASDKFQGYMTQWTTEMNNVLQTLSKISTFLNVAESSYNEADTSLVNSLPS